MSFRLNTRHVTVINFTVEDDALLALVNMAKYPIGLDITDEMIIFNNQCYHDEFLRSFVLLRLQVTNGTHRVAIGI